MLKKDLMIPGNLIKVRPVIKDGVSGPGTPAKTYLTLQSKPGESLFHAHSGIGPGAILEVVKGPKKYDNINCAMVKEPGGTREFYVYWCELRASCDHI